MPLLRRISHFWLKSPEYGFRADLAADGAFELHVLR